MRHRVFVLEWAYHIWTQVYLDDRLFYAGEAPAYDVWLDLLCRLGAEVVHKWGLLDHHGTRFHEDNLCLVDYPAENLTGLDLSQLLTDTVGAE